MNLFKITIYGLFVLGGLLTAQETKLVDEEFLSKIRNEASRNHPAVVSSALRSKAAARDIRGVRLWDDPTVGLSVMAADTAMRRDDGDVRVSLEQALPKPGLYAANVSKAEALERAEVENAKYSSLEIGTVAAKDVIELALADESIAIQRGQIKWLSTMAENARQLSLNPASTSVDPLRLESELAGENQILAAAQRTREIVASRLNLRLGRPLDSKWPVLRFTQDPLPIPVARTEISRIPRANPKVRSMMEMASAAKAETRIVDKDSIPQVSIAVESDLYSGGDFRSASLGLKMSLPFFNRSVYSARSEASQLREKAALKDVEIVRLEVAAGVLAAASDAANAAAQARAYSGEVYQRADAATRAAEGSWISSKATLTDLLVSNRQLFSIRLEQRRFVAMQQAALEELNQLVPSHP